MATNILSKSRTKYVKVAEFAEIYSISRAHAYKLIAKPIFIEARKKVGEKAIRIDLDKAIEIMQQYYR